MDRSFYTGAVGAIAHQERLNMIANNLANVNTNGYKRKVSSFSECIYSNLNAPAGEQTNYIAGSGLHIEKTDADFSQGAMATTGKEYDYMLKGEGFFAVMDPMTGETTYTRDGSFSASLANDGNFYLVTANGKRVLDTNQNPIILGSRTVQEENATNPQYHMVSGEDLIGQIGIYTFASTNGMESNMGTEFVSIEKNGQPVITASDRETLEHKALEMSNVNIADEMSKIIEAQRCYQYALKMVQTSDEVETTINSLRS